MTLASITQATAQDRPGALDLSCVFFLRSAYRAAGVAWLSMRGLRAAAGRAGHAARGVHQRVSHYELLQHSHHGGLGDGGPLVANYAA